MIHHKLACFTLAAICSAPFVDRANAQSVTVGTVTRDSTIYTGPNDLPESKEVNKFLSSLESSLAGEVANAGAVQYEDRSSMLELFRELHLSSSNAFDGTTGATRGLLGRLDFLVVIDSSDPASAKMRLIDVETGTVRGVENCTRRFMLLGLSSQQPPDCIPAMAHRIASAGKQKGIAKAARIEHDRQMESDAHLSQMQRVAAEKQERVAADARLAKQSELAKAERDAARLAAETQARQLEAARAYARKQISELEPAWSDARERQAAMQDFWAGIEQQMSNQGRSVRPEIRSLLRNTSEDLANGSNAIAGSDAMKLQAAIASLNGKLSKLEEYK